MSRKQKQQQAAAAQVGAMQEFVELKPAAELWSSPSAQQPEAEPDDALAGQRAGAGGRSRGGSRGRKRVRRNLGGAAVGGRSKSRGRSARRGSYLGPQFS